MSLVNDNKEAIWGISENTLSQVSNRRLIKMGNRNKTEWCLQLKGIYILIASFVYNKKTNSLLNILFNRTTFNVSSRKN